MKTPEEISAATILKYKKHSVAKLKNKAQIVFNKWIRERDKNLPCISCGSGIPSQATHFYSAGHYNQLRFNEDNCHLGCVRCNYFLSGNLNEYRKRLEIKIGKERLRKLDEIAAIKKAYKFDRFTLIAIIEKYKSK